MTGPEILSLKHRCCGCGACVPSCPKNCITMIQNGYGFYHPSINLNICINCNKCSTICPILNVPTKHSSKGAFWAIAKDTTLLKRSSSGGIFGLIAKEILSHEGIVIGAAWSKDCKMVKHIVVDDISSLDKIMRSKYLQSSIDQTIYHSINRALTDNTPVLFCGTACQIAAVRSYLGKLSNSNLLLTIDVICHGVSSPQLWYAWVSLLENQLNGKIFGVNFRSKITGWQSYSIEYKYISRTDDTIHVYSEKFTEDWYAKAFLNNASIRLSCFSCPFKQQCGSDITLGDFWGIQQQHAAVNPENGVSAVLINTNKGFNAFKQIEENICFGKSTVDKIAAENPALIHPLEPYSRQKEFMSEFVKEKLTSNFIKKWNFRPLFKTQILKKLLNIVKRIKPTIK